MSNYYRNRYNDFIDNAGYIHSYLTGSYMERFAGQLLDTGDLGIEIGSMQFVRILGYRRTEDIQKDFENISAAVRASLGVCTGLDAAFGYFVVSDEGEFSVYIGVEEMPVNRIVSELKAVIPDVKTKSGFVSANTLQRLSRYGGIISGNTECESGAADIIISGMSLVNGIVAILAVPMDTREIMAYAAEMSNFRKLCGELSSNNSANGRGIYQNYAYIPEIKDYLEKNIKYYTRPGENYWKYSIWFGCEQENMAEGLGSSLSAAFGSGITEGLGNTCYHFTVNNPFQTGRLFLPIADYSDNCYDFPEILKKPSLISYAHASGLSSLIQLPTNSVKGFELIEPEKDKNSLHLFDTEYRTASADAPVLGVYEDSDVPFSLELDDMMEHVLITGATGAGKTNTVMGLVKAISGTGVPVLIIEPSKKDYWKLAAEIRNLRILSFAQDAEFLKINPLMPEEGTIIANHIDSLLHAFSGAFEMEAPTKFALSGLLKFTYERFGFGMNEIAVWGRKKYPKIQDLLSFLPEYAKTGLFYGEEVKSNVFGSLVNRLSMLNSGLMGESFNSDRVLSGKDLCCGNVLIELDDLSLENKPFVSMLLMIKAEQYLRQGNAANKLRNVIVLEEAHNIFANVSNGNVSDTARLASETFSNMLSQIREYGTGIIIADQGASQINDTAVANTKIKIIHGITDGRDIDKVAFALNLTDVQKRVFPSLERGEAVVSVRGRRNVSKVRINHNSVSQVQNIACIFCQKRRNCGDFNKALGQVITRKSVYAQQVYACRFNPDGLKNTVKSIADHIGWEEERRNCLLGYLLEDESLRCSEREKRRIINLFNHNE